MRGSVVLQLLRLLYAVLLNVELRRPVGVEASLKDNADNDTFVVW